MLILRKLNINIILSMAWVRVGCKKNAQKTEGNGLNSLWRTKVYFWGRLRLEHVLHGLLIFILFATLERTKSEDSVSKPKLSPFLQTSTTAAPSTYIDEYGNILTIVNRTLTGIPQIDYVSDPNLPRELNGYNLSTYPFFSRVPANVNFSCSGLKDGFYANIEYKCQIYHHCLSDQRQDFLCANYTAFDQKTFICNFVSEIDCENSALFWHRNDALYKATTTIAPPPQIIGGGRRIRPSNYKEVNESTSKPEQPIRTGSNARPPANRPGPNRPNRLRCIGRRGRRNRRCRRPIVDYYDYYDYYDDYSQKGDYYEEDEPSTTSTTTTTTTTKKPEQVEVDREKIFSRSRNPPRIRPPVPQTTTTARPSMSDYYYEEEVEEVSQPVPKITTTTTTTTTPSPDYYDGDDYEYPDEVSTTIRSQKRPQGHVSQSQTKVAEVRFSGDEVGLNKRGQSQGTHSKLSHVEYGNDEINKRGQSSNSKIKTLDAQSGTEEMNKRGQSANVKVTDLHSGNDESRPTRRPFLNRRVPNLQPSPEARRPIVQTQPVQIQTNVNQRLNTKQIPRPAQTHQDDRDDLELDYETGVTHRLTNQLRSNLKPIEEPKFRRPANHRVDYKPEDGPSNPRIHIVQDPVQGQQKPRPRFTLRNSHMLIPITTKAPVMTSHIPPMRPQQQDDYYYDEPGQTQGHQISLMPTMPTLMNIYKQITPFTLHDAVSNSKTANRPDYISLVDEDTGVGETKWGYFDHSRSSRGIPFPFYQDHQQGMYF